MLFCPLCHKRYPAPEGAGPFKCPRCPAQLEQFRRPPITFFRRHGYPRLKWAQRRLRNLGEWIYAEQKRLGSAAAVMGICAVILMILNWRQAAPGSPLTARTDAAYRVAREALLANMPSPSTAQLDGRYIGGEALPNQFVICGFVMSQPYLGPLLRQSWGAHLEWLPASERFAVRSLDLDGDLIYLDPETHSLEERIGVAWDNRERLGINGRRLDVGWRRVADFEGRSRSLTAEFETHEARWRVRWECRVGTLTVGVMNADGDQVATLKMRNGAGATEGAAATRLPPGKFRLKVLSSPVRWRLTVEE